MLYQKREPFKIIGTFCLLLAGLLTIGSCNRDREHQNPRFVNGVYDEVLTAFPSLEVKYSYEDSTKEKAVHHYAFKQVYLKKASGEPFSGTLTNTHWNDSLKVKATFEQGKVRKFETWYPNGQQKKKIIVHPEANPPYLSRKQWYTSGELKMLGEKDRKERYYKSGKLKSVETPESATEYWENGNRQSYWTFANGRYGFKPDGEWKAWHENGQLGIKGQYVNGEKEGRWVHRDSTGTITKVIFYHQGEVDSTISDL